MRRLLITGLVGGLLLTGSGAWAVSQPTVTVVKGQTTQTEYGPIPGNMPAAPNVNWTPTGCDTTGPGGTQCDRIPVKIPIPTDIDEADDYYVEIAISWDDPEGVNDLDVYFWDNRQLQQQNGVEPPGFTEIGRSASSSNPEIIKIVNPALVDYNLTVLNWAGPNLGYKVTAKNRVSQFDSPFESLAPEFRQPGQRESDTFVPHDFSGDEPLTSSPVFSAPTPPIFGEIAITPDVDYSDFGSSDFDDALSAPAMPSARSALSAGPAPADVPLIVVLFWFLVVPLALVAVAAVLLIRRSRSIGLAYT